MSLNYKQEEYLYQKFSNPEGELTNWRAALVNGEMLSGISKELGFEEYFYGEGITLIEWAERIPSYLPETYFEVCLRIAPDFSRAIRLAAVGKQGEPAFQAAQQIVSRAAEAGVRRD